MSGLNNIILWASCLALASFTFGCGRDFEITEHEVSVGASSADNSPSESIPIDVNASPDSVMTPDGLQAPASQPKASDTIECRIDGFDGVNLLRKEIILENRDILQDEFERMLRNSSPLDTIAYFRLGVPLSEVNLDTLQLSLDGMPVDYKVDQEYGDLQVLADLIFDDSQVIATYCLLSPKKDNAPSGAKPFKKDDDDDDDDNDDDLIDQADLCLNKNYHAQSVRENHSNSKGHGHRKVCVCHKGKVTIRIPAHAAEKHLFHHDDPDHEDYLGACVE